MTEPAVDAERLAALLDGRLDGRERAELVARLGSSGADAEVFADALAATAELEGSGVEDGVVPLRPPTRARRRPGGRWLALAAVLAAVAVAPVLWTRARAADVGDPARFVALVEGGPAGLPPGWESRPWPATRSADAAITDEARAARVGALLVDLELAVEARDPAAAELAGEVARLLEGVPASALAVRGYRRVAGSAGGTPERVQPLLDEWRPEAVRIVGEDLAGLGAWAEAGRIAAARRNAGFFRARVSRAALERAARLPGLPADARSALERVRNAGSGDGAPDWAALERDLTLVLRALGG